MIELDDISRIGFGAYRVSVRSPQHGAALVHALRAGCTLVDTASTYTGGESEQLIGKVVRECPELDFFLVTKAGYPVSPDAAHCLAPDFLRARLQESIDRVGRDRIDGMLLHNPENSFGDDYSEFGIDRFDGLIRHAFEFLEDMVEKGLIRYWGVSSNTLNPAPDGGTQVELQRLLDIAGDVSVDHHFRLLEFPFNLLESGVAQPDPTESALSLARRSGLRTIGNRPLNARHASGQVRLATYDAESRHCERMTAERTLEQFLDLIDSRLAALGKSDVALDFTVIKFLHDAWPTLNDPDLVHAVFRERLAPFIDCLHPDGVPAEERRFLARFEQFAAANARKNMSDATSRLRARLEREGTIVPGDPRAMAEIAIAHCLDAGVQHVLVGMRQPAYVDALARYL
jgi:aryl-alcohol dehydrogenase-like predicted oxidoreductase